MTQTEGLVSGFARSIRAHEPLPEVSEQLELVEAYQLQHKVTALRTGDVPGGIKLGVTNPAAQGFFGLDHALLGSLYRDSRLESGATIPFLEGRALETEFAVLVDESGNPKAIAPAIEIVFVSLSRKSDMSAANLVVSNLGADLFLVGEFLPWDSPHSDVVATLRRGDEVVNEASMNDALGGPTKALPWIWEEVQKRGYAVNGDTLIMMGACGSVVPAEQGSYQADYGAMGSLAFSVG